jgi:uncharacterized protein
MPELWGDAQAPAGEAVNLSLSEYLLLTAEFQEAKRMIKAMVLYHANCSDGFGAAWAAWKVLGDNAVYVPVQYDQPYPPEIDRGMVESLYILDFSYPLETMQRLMRQVNRMVVIDHHATAEEALDLFGDGPAEVIFSQAHSGAYLAWQYFHGQNPVPILLRFVEDRDTWAWRLLWSNEINAAIRSYPMTFSEWDCLAEVRNIDSLAPEGEAILRAQAQQVESHVKSARLARIGGYEVPVVNATVLMSEIGEALCEKFPEQPFSGTFFVRDDGLKVWSLRSRNGFDVGAVAKSLGGGGHAAAAGFTESA